MKNGVILYGNGIEQPTNSGKFDKEGKDKKSINAQNIVNAFAYVNLRNSFTKRIQDLLERMKFIFTCQCKTQSIRKLRLHAEK